MCRECECAAVFRPRSGRGQPLTESTIPASLLERLLALPAVRLAACRADAGGVVVRTTGMARLTEAAGVVCYQPDSGDPLGLGGYLELDDRDLLSRTRETDMPTPHASSCSCSRHPGPAISCWQQRRARFPGALGNPRTQGRSRQYHAEHMEVPIAASVAVPDAPVRTVDLMPTILECLDVPVPTGVVLDGVPFSKIPAATEPLVR